MPTHTTADIRNILLTGHGSSGKTTLADAMLFATNTVTRKGSVLDGTSVSDFEKEEKEHKHSIFRRSFTWTISASASIFWTRRARRT